MGEKELDLWVTRLLGENLPIFDRTVQSVTGTVSRESSLLSDLAWSILQDPALTALVLKMANSIYYNPSAKRISTVSRAVLQLGSDIIKGMCLSIALAETVLSSPCKEKTALEVARAFHSAIQAREIAIRRNLPGPEEVYIAALLTRLGNIAFWCCGGEAAEQLERAMSDGESEELAQLKVLGFKLEKLTLRLSQEWKLSDLLDSALSDKKGNDPRVRCINLGCSVAEASEKGWDSPQIMGLIVETGSFLNLPHDAVTKTLHASARSAVEIMQSFGTGGISRLVPIPDGTPSQASARITEIQHEYLKPDPVVQLCSLRDISALVTSGRGDFNMVLSIVMEGIYRGLGMDRVLFALLTPDRLHLKGKYGLGWNDEDFVESFLMSVNMETPNIFGYILRNRRPVWVTDEPHDMFKYYITVEMSSLTGGSSFFAMPVVVKGTAIGVIYADRNPSRRGLDDESFENFAFFGQQANLNLSALSGS